MSLYKLLAASHDAGHILSSRHVSVPMDIDPLPVAQYRGLIAVSVLAILSFLATLGLICFVTYRLVFWRGNYQRYIGYNQYVILIYNLVLADLQQSLAFLICIKWIAEDKIQASSVACFLQGFWLQVGDPASGLFVLAIAFHTFLLVTMGIKMSHRVFVAYVIGIWLFVAVLVIIPIAAHGRDVFVPSGAWCWINVNYEAIRLGTHYIWIFLAEFGTVCLYGIMWFHLRRQIQQSAILGSSHTESLKRLRRVIGYMVIYPIAYIVLSLPLAAGRMASARGNNPSLVYFCIAGAMITSSGLVDVLLYSFTRRNLILDSEPSHDRSYNRFPSSKYRKDITTITGEPRTLRTDITALRSRNGRDDDDEVSETVRDGSTDNIVQNPFIEMTPMGKVIQHTTIEITTEPAYPQAEASDRSSKDSLEGPTKGNKNPSKMWGR